MDDSAALPTPHSLIERFAGRFPVHSMRRLRLPDGRFRYEFVSPAVTDAFGLDSEALVAADAVDHAWVHADDREHFIAALNHSADHLTPLDEEVRVLAGNGMIRWVRSLGDPVRLEDGTVRWDGVALDVTDRRVAMERVRDAMEVARAAEVAATAPPAVPGSVRQAVAALEASVAAPDDQLDLARIRTLVSQLSRAIGPERGASPGAATDPRLTPRQEEIARLIASGLSNREIGAELGLTEGTVKLHASRILKRLGLRRRIELAKLFHESG